MKHDLYWDADNGCIRFDVHDILSRDDTRTMLELLPVMFEKHDSKLLLVDHSNSPMALPADAREYLREHAGEVEVGKMAFFGLSHLTRLTAKIIVRAIGFRDMANFFKSEQDALAWLHE